MTSLDRGFQRFMWSGWILIVALMSGGGTVTAQESQPRKGELVGAQAIESRVEAMLVRMTLEEKIALVHADSKFSTAAIPRLGLPRRWLSDGPHGVREALGADSFQPAGRTDDFVTYMPALIGLAATWNPQLAQDYGGVIGQEGRARGKGIMLGPGMNIMRTPLNGRSFEYFGEDPYLVSRMVVPYIRGVQAEGVAACAKHFVGNDQEWKRSTINVEMDERTLREIYLPPFRAAVREAGVLTVMSSYNKFRGAYAAENDYLINGILKGEWQFKGLVMSDWNGTHSTRGSVLAGLDLEMGTDGRAYKDFYLADSFLAGIRAGQYPQSVLDDKVRRNLRQMFTTQAAADGATTGGALNTKEHQATARAVAEESLVLLKNEGATLPLDANKISSIAVIGENAVRLQAQGGGSAGVKAFYEVTPLEGIVRRAGETANVSFSLGYREGVEPSGSGDLIARAVRAASAADVAVIVGGLNHAKFQDAESADRRDLKLPYGQDELIRRVSAANPRTVVVLIGGGPVEMDAAWLARVPAIVAAWYPGMEGGHALARVLFGDVNPSGKLPCTFPLRLADSPAHALDAYPGTDGTVGYAEGLLVGYRWFDAKRIAPLFPFGHGLSYTRFNYANLRLVAGESGTPDAPLTVEFELTNTGAREGAEVAQVYVGAVSPRVVRPPDELKGFSKVSLKPGERRTVSIRLAGSEFAYYDPARKLWVADAGDYKIMVGTSSRDVRLEGVFHLAQTLTGR